MKVNEGESREKLFSFLAGNTPKSTHISRISGINKKVNYRNKVNYFDLKSPLDVERKGEKKVLRSLQNSEGDFVLNIAKVEAIKGSAAEEKPWQLNSNSKKIVKSQNQEIQTTTQESTLCNSDKAAAVARFPEEPFPCTVYPEEEIHNFSSDLDKAPDGLVPLGGSTQNEENSKPFMGSIGSWINDFFSAQTKCSSSPRSETDEILNKSVVEEDAEYLKSINAIKEQFKKKLKSETSIQVSTPDEPFIFNFDKVLDNGKKQAKNAKSTAASSASSWMETLKEFDAQMPELPEKSGGLFNSNTGELIIRTNSGMSSHTTCASKTNSMSENKSKKNLRNKPRPNLTELEDYAYPTTTEPLKRLLLAASNEEKSMPLGVQETQPYGARKSRSKQSNARCYTTNANRTDAMKCSQVDTKGLSQFYGHNIATRKEIDEILRKKSMSSRKGEVHRPARKDFSEATSDSMTCLKRKSSKSTGRIPIEPTKIESKKSDELVKVLMKKVKTARSHNLRSKPTNNQVTQTPYMTKNKIMQSATSALVNLLAKRDNMLPAKVYDGKMYSGKELVLKSSDSRFDISRTLSGSKFNGLSYLLDDNKAEEDALFTEKAQRKNAKREETEETKKLTSKLTKRKEVEHMFSKIDEKFIPSHLWVAKQKEKKFVLQSALESLNDESKELQLARFQRQHQLFKTNMKTSQPTGETSQTLKEETLSNSPTNASPSTELAVVDANCQLESVSNQEKSVCYEEDEAYAYPAEFDHNFTVEEVAEEPETESPRRSGRKTDSSPLSKEKFKNKAIQFQKESQSSELLTPLEKLYISVHQKEEPPESGAGDSNSGKSDTVLSSRKNYSNTASESNQNVKCLPCASHKSGLYLTDTKKEAEKKEKNKKVSTPKSEKRDTADESLELY